MSSDFRGLSFRNLDPYIITELITKNGPRITSRSADPNANVLNLSMFNLSEILMRQPAFQGFERPISWYESIVSGTLGGLLFDENEEDLASMAPDDVIAKVLSMGLDAPGSSVPEGADGVRAPSDPVDDVGGGEAPSGAGESQGVRRAKAAVKERFSWVNTAGNVQSCRRIARTTRWSQHAYGNAWDIYGPRGYKSAAQTTASDKAYMQQVTNFLQANRAKLNIASLCFRSFGPCSAADHQNHIHVDFNPRGSGTPSCARR